MKAIAFDAMGVIYSTSDDVSELLCPFVRNNGGIGDVDKINSLYKTASLGKLSSNSFWKAVGINPELENQYLRKFSLTNGILSLLLKVNASGKETFCLSNDVAEWSRKLRNRFHLGRCIKDFIISGEVGSRKPEKAIYKELLKRARVAASEILVVDDRIANLDAAAELGMRTVLYTEHLKSQSERHFAAKNCSELMSFLRKK